MKTCQILFFTCCFALLGLPAVAAEGDFLTYDKFITEVESGSVKSANLDRYSQIRGTYTIDGVERPFHSFGDIGTANDILLTRLLKQKNVTVTLKDQEERSAFFAGPGMVSALLLFLVPIITLILALRINSKLNRLSHVRSIPDKESLQSGNSSATCNAEQPCRPAVTTPRAMKLFSDLMLATRMLETRDRGYSFTLFFRRNARRYLLLFSCFGVVLVAFGILRNWMPFYLMLGILAGCILRDIGWVRTSGKTWPFTLKVIDWEKVQRLAQKKTEV